MIMSLRCCGSARKLVSLRSLGEHLSRAEQPNKPRAHKQLQQGGRLLKCIPASDCRAWQLAHAPSRRGCRSTKTGGAVQASAAENRARGNQRMLEVAGPLLRPTQRETALPAPLTQTCNNQRQRRRERKSPALRIAVLPRGANRTATQIASGSCTVWGLGQGTVSGLSELLACHRCIARPDVLTR